MPIKCKHCGGPRSYAQDDRCMYCGTLSPSARERADERSIIARQRRLVRAIHSRKNSEITARVVLSIVVFVTVLSVTGVLLRGG